MGNVNVPPPGIFTSSTSSTRPTPSQIMGRLSNQPVGAERWETVLTNSPPDAEMDFLSDVRLPGASRALTQGELASIRDGSIRFYEQASLAAGGSPGPALARALARALSLAPAGASAGASAAARFAPPGFLAYTGPVKPARPFGADYPKGARNGPDGRLPATMDGDPIVARYIAGRSQAGGLDAPIPGKEYDAIATGLTGRPPEGVSPRQLRGDAGRFVELPGSGGSKRLIQYDATLSPAERDQTIAHEIGHAIPSVLGGPINQKGVKSDLAQNWNTMNTGEERTRHLSTPANLQNYRPHEVPGENMAEAIRAYMADPNSFKTRHPALAERIRRSVNNDPDINKTIQFNSLIGGLLALPGADER